MLGLEAHSQCLGHESCHALGDAAGETGQSPAVHALQNITLSSSYPSLSLPLYLYLCGHQGRSYKILKSLFLLSVTFGPVLLRSHGRHRVPARGSSRWICQLALHILSIQVEISNPVNE